MKLSKIFSNGLKAGLVPVMLTTAMSVVAEPAAPKAAPKPEPVHSVFILPTSPQQGRDPFFPSSTRPYQEAVPPAAHHNEVVDISTLLSLQGFSGTTDQRLVIINKRTFAVGDQAEVSTSQGKVRIQCLEISTNTAVIEANGQRINLHYEKMP